ncbi:ABC transporter, substrate binding protein, PQQ-dependent alcohol dehydrogenase system [Marisediminitalea aggregata]|uniref:ABC transporter, substrate binding protein, PQQ-dependent alcohol dehydrogenase system n=1 Tax=Marisediminitalea aggregata TaxID=634436 RepID=A0A1M5EW95_9ALTE|nr:ABC transporter substrate-binding protein [Marisediminitalea aggregata]SHF83510.1 ABC transporter, substrate binding protein, PQQ-dependent alcohol dehydrogenase system [Marisediminitalea aggregata]
MRFIATTTKSLCWLFLLQKSAFAAVQNIDILYVKLHAEMSAEPLLLKQPADNKTLAGAKLAIEDSNTTGRFLKQHYQLTVVEDNNADGVISQLKRLLSVQEAPGTVLVDVPENAFNAVSEVIRGSGALVMNISSREDALRQSQCAEKVLHTVPSRAMLADAMTQYLMSRRWREWFLVSGNSDGDKAFASALQRSAKRFGANIVEQKQWSFDTDLRRVAQKEIPLFTQHDDYDVVVVADEQHLFDKYFPGNTWLPRPVVGTEGLVPTGWHWTLEQWGATQLQNRFYSQFAREMTESDYAAWLAVRAISEAVTRTKSTASDVLYDYLLSDSFELAAFKGRKLSFRAWNGQLRQPIPLVHPNGLTALLPLEGYMHPVTDLDTLGYDKPEVRCNMAK